MQKNIKELVTPLVKKHEASEIAGVALSSGADMEDIDVTCELDSRSNDLYRVTVTGDEEVISAVELKLTDLYYVKPDWEVKSVS